MHLPKSLIFAIYAADYVHADNTFINTLLEIV